MSRPHSSLKIQQFKKDATALPFTRTTVMINIPGARPGDPPLQHPIEALVYGGLAIHHPYLPPSSDHLSERTRTELVTQWDLTHVQSGGRVGRFPSRQQAKVAVLRLTRLRDWTQPGETCAYYGSPNKYPDAQVVRRILHDPYNTDSSLH